MGNKHWRKRMLALGLACSVLFAVPAQTEESLFYSEDLGLFEEVPGDAVVAAPGYEEISGIAENSSNVEMSSPAAPDAEEGELISAAADSEESVPATAAETEAETAVTAVSGEEEPSSAETSEEDGFVPTETASGSEETLLDDAPVLSEADTESESVSEISGEALGLPEEEIWEDLFEEEILDSAEELMDEPADEEISEIVREYFAAESSGTAIGASRGSAPVLSGYSSYGAQLSGDGKRIYDSLVSAWAARGETGNVYYEFPKSITVKKANYEKTLKNLRYQIQCAYEAFSYDHPEVFWLGDMSYGFRGIEGSSSIVLWGVEIVGWDCYSGARKEMTAFNAAVNAGVKAVKAKLPSNADRYETVAAIHDYVCGQVAYQENSYAHSAAGVFLYHKAVCEGYAKAFKILCGKFGIPCALIVGDAIAYEGDSSEPHMWNYVKMEDGAWYLVDTTWDDGPFSYGSSTYECISQYLLLGSASAGMYLPVSRERTVSGTFSNSENTKNFGVPALSKKAYVHHKWKVVSRVEPTCTAAGSVKYQCSIHGETKTETLSAQHTFSKYVSDGNATALKDGTKTAVCDRCRKAKSTVTDKGSKLKAYAKTNAASVVLKKKQSTSAFRVTEMQKGDSILSWTSSNNKIVKVSGTSGGTCRLSAQKKTGTAVVTITFRSGLKKTFKVKVQKGNVKTKAITGVQANLTLRAGKSHTLTPVLSPFTSKEKIKYSTSNKKVASVSKKGKITAKKKGKAKITVKAGKIKVVCRVTVE